MKASAPLLCTVLKWLLQLHIGLPYQLARTFARTFASRRWYRRLPPPGPALRALWMEETGGRQGPWMGGRWASHALRYGLSSFLTPSFVTITNTSRQPHDHELRQHLNALVGSRGG